MLLLRVFLVVLLSSAAAGAEDDSAASDPRLEHRDARALTTIFDDRWLADRALDIHRQAMKLAAEERYTFLAEWVLPNRRRDTFRLSLDFTPTHPPPIATAGHAQDRQRVQQAGRDAVRVQLGGNLVAPAVDLIEVARELGKLQELRARTDSAPAGDEFQQRSRHALLALIDLAADHPQQALGELERLVPLVKAHTEFDVADHAPETLAIWFALRQPRVRELAKDMLFHIHTRQLQPVHAASSPAWEQQMLALIGLLYHIEQQAGPVERFGTSPQFRQWSPVSYATAQTRGDGGPVSHWRRVNGGVDNLAGHDQDYLYFQSPLRGNFEVECEVTGHGWREAHLSVAGAWVAPGRFLAKYEFGDFRSKQTPASIEPKLSRIQGPIRYRTVVRHGVATTYFNGREVHQRQLATAHDPWLAVRSWSQNPCGVRDLRITGEPVVPDVIDLAASNELEGWLPYFGESIGGPKTAWRNLDGEIFGRRLGPDLRRANKESLLRYHRPMLEDGTIEYEFFYRPDEVVVYPALDRLAFLLEPGGVHIHWITDGVYDRTGIDPANVFDEPQNRRGKGALPLRPDEWNRLRFALAGDTVALHLNDQLVCERRLEATNQRTFGLFRYCDRTATRVRKIRWRGDWPRELPSLAEQELAGPGTDALDARLAELAAGFEHDLTIDGLPSRLFSGDGNGWENHLSVRPDGVHVERPAETDIAQQFAIVPHIGLSGDFDVTVWFDNLQTEVLQERSRAGVGLIVNPDHPTIKQCAIFRRHNWQPRFGLQQVANAHSRIEIDEAVRNTTRGTAEESVSGALRLARRGDKVFYLFAEGDSSFFRLIAEETITDADVPPGGIRIIVEGTAHGRAKTVWKWLRIRAKKIVAGND